MIPRIFAAVAFALVINASAIPISLAQSEDQPPEETAIEAPVPASLNVTPAGIARQDWEAIRDIVLSVPSPGGDALTTSVGGGFDSYRVAATLDLDGQFQRFTYDCNPGRCTGFATDIWRSIPTDQRQAYADSILDALIAAFPIDRGSYSVGIGGRDAKGQVGIRVEQIGTGQRFYRSVGDPLPAARPTGSTAQP